MSLDRDIELLCDSLVELLRERGLDASRNTGKDGLRVPGGVLRAGLTRGEVYVGGRLAVSVRPGSVPGSMLPVVWDGTIGIRVEGSDLRYTTSRHWIELDHEAICDAVVSAQRAEDVRNNGGSPSYLGRLMSNTVQKMTSSQVKDTPSKTAWSYQASISQPKGKTKGSYSGKIVLDKDNASVSIYANNTTGTSSMIFSTSSGKSTEVGAAIFRAFVNRN